MCNEEIILAPECVALALSFWELITKSWNVMPDSSVFVWLGSLGHTG